jgi:hypothetical protein
MSVNDPSPLPEGPDVAELARQAAARQAEQLARLAGDVARRLNRPTALPAGAIAAAMVAMNRMAVGLEKPQLLGWGARTVWCGGDAGELLVLPL